MTIVGFERKIVELYLRYGSVDKLLENSQEVIPYSYPEIHRILDKYGVVKTVGRQHTNFAELMLFCEELAKRKLPLKEIYEVMPPNFKTSLSSLHRTLHNIKNGIAERYGTALVVTAKGKPSEILLAHDISMPRKDVGKEFNSISIPMGFSSPYDSLNESVARLMQQELFSVRTIQNDFPYDLIQPNLMPFMYITVADVVVSVYHIEIDSQDVNQFSSFKLENYQFLPLSEVENIKDNVRSGVKEIAAYYRKIVIERVDRQSISVGSELNRLIPATAEYKA